MKVYKQARWAKFGNCPKCNKESMKQFKVDNWHRCTNLHCNVAMFESDTFFVEAFDTVNEKVNWILP